MKHTTKKVKKLKSVYSRDLWDNPKMYDHFEVKEWKKYNKDNNKKITLNQYQTLIVNGRIV